MALTKEQRLANLARGRQKAIENRRKRAAERKAAPAPKKPVPPEVNESQQPGMGDFEEEEEEGLLFDVEAAPDGLIDPPTDEGTLSKVFRKLGLKGNSTSANDEPAPRAASVTAKLNKHQQSLYDSFAPLAIQAFILVSGWTWGRLGEDYQALAPDEQTATRIIAPLMRVYARTSKIGTALNPNHADLAASMAALVGYVWTSYGLYKQIKAEKAEEYDDGYQPVSTAPSNIRSFDERESGHSSADARRGAPGATGTDGRAASRGNGYHESNLDLSKLSPDEQYAYEKLSRLRQLDYASRARRSGFAG